MWYATVWCIFFYLNTHTDTCTHTQTPKSKDLMRPVETLPNCQSTPQLADMRPTTSMTSFLKLRVPAELHQMQREGWGPLDKEEIRWREGKEARGWIKKKGSVNVCVCACVCVWLVGEFYALQNSQGLGVFAHAAAHCHAFKARLRVICMIYVREQRQKKIKACDHYPCSFRTACKTRPPTLFLGESAPRNRGGGISLSRARAREGQGRKVSQDAHGHGCVSVPSRPGVDPRCYGLCQRIVSGHDRHAIYMAVCN